LNYKKKGMQREEQGEKLLKKGNRKERERRKSNVRVIKTASKKKEKILKNVREVK